MEGKTLRQYSAGSSLQMSVTREQGPSIDKVTKGPLEYIQGLPSRRAAGTSFSSNAGCVRLGSHFGV